MAYVFAFGSALAIFWVLFILLGMWGTFFIALTRITFWPFIFEAALFLTAALAGCIAAAANRPSKF